MKWTDLDGGREFLLTVSQAEDARIERWHAYPGGPADETALALDMVNVFIAY
jgi:hypothetical protein